MFIESFTNFLRPMRLLLLLASAVLFLSFPALSQDRQDILYLKNGSVLKGKIIEKEKDRKMKFREKDGTVNTYSEEEIEDMEEDVAVEAEEKGKTAKASKKGYVGLSVGVNIPMGQFASKTGDDLNNAPGFAKSGVQLNLVNFGYLFTEHIGICGVIFAATNNIDVEDVDPWGYGGVLVGPLISYPIGSNIDWDLRPMIGYSMVNLSSRDKIGNQQSSAFGMNLGTMFRFHVSKSVSLTLNGDYFFTKAKFSKYELEQKVTSLCIGGGIAFRLN
jgi:hypothetical protein